MADVSFNIANPYQTQLEELARRQKMAEIMQQQSFQPIERSSYQGIEAPISPLSGLAKALQGYMSGREQKKISEERKTLGEKYRQEGMDDITRFAEMAGRPAVAATPGSEAFMPATADYQDRGNAPAFKLDEQGMVPAVDPVAARMRGQIDPAMIGQFKTPEMQRMALAQMLKQGELPAAFNLGAEETRFQPPVGGGAPVAVARGAAKPLPSPFAPVDVSKFTQASVTAAMKPDGTVDRTLLVPIPERRTGQLGVYDEYAAQERAAGRVPKSIERFETDQRIAGRTPAAQRERFVYDATRGGRVNLDTGELMPVTQGGVPIGVKERPLTTGEVEKITSIDNAFGTQKRLADTFQDSYGGYTFKAGGELANVFGGKFGGDNQAQAEWWASHEANDNVARNALFGASLTAGEQKAWDKTTINPGMSPSMIKNRMTERQDLIDAKRKTMIGNLDKAGYDVKGFKDNPNFYKPVEKTTTIAEITDVAKKTGKTVKQVTDDAVAKGYKVNQ
jgi:hypothetical protein